MTIPDAQNAIATYPIATLDGEREQGDLAGVHRLRDVVEGSGDAEVVRVPPAVVSRRGRRVPWLAVLVALVGFAFIALPLIGLIQQVPWGNLWTDLTDPRGDGRAAALGRSARCGRPRSRWCSASRSRGCSPGSRSPAGRSCARSCCCPLVVPPVVGGVGLFYAFGRNGLVGQYLYDWFGIQLTFSTAGVVMAETFVAMPFLVITVEAALRSMDRRYEDAAATLGARAADRRPPRDAAADPARA